VGSFPFVIRIITHKYTTTKTQKQHKNSCISLTTLTLNTLHRQKDGGRVFILPEEMLKQVQHDERGCQHDGEGESNKLLSPSIIIACNISAGH
ncbi:MAG: hypothetical protein SNG97_05890, partial [Rikenellaceae bacterium]